MCAKANVLRSEESHLISSLSKDLVQFIELAKSGQLYEFIRDHAGLPTGVKGRAQAKLMMFEICFSKHNNHTTAKAKLRELFPNLVGMIDAYKKQNGNNQFAITLQKEESRLFIDIILPKLYKAGYKVLSKHDSILCKESDKEAVERLMREELDEALGDYQLKAECT